MFDIKFSPLQKPSNGVPCVVIPISPWHFICLLPLCVESVAGDEPLKLRWLRWRLKGRRCVWKRGPWGRRPRRLERSFVGPDASPSAPEAGQRMEFPKDATPRSPHAKTVSKQFGFYFTVSRIGQQLWLHFRFFVKLLSFQRRSSKIGNEGMKN